MSDNNRHSDTWGNYTFAAVTTGALWVFRYELDQLTGSQIPVPLCGLAAVFACVWKAGTGPALTATALTTAWYVWDSHALTPDAWIRYAIYAAEAGLLCFYGRQLRATEDRAAQGEDWQQHLVQTAGEGIWTVDSDGVIGYANSRIAEILGCDTGAITGHKFEEFLFPEDRPAERIRFQSRRSGVKEQFDRRLRRTDGTEAWTLACSSPYSLDGKETGLLTMMTDITERKKAEHALRLSERKYRELFENIREGVYQTSPDGRILAANPELLRMLGVSNQEELNVVGVVRDTFVDTALHQSLRDRLERDGSYANVEFQLRGRDSRIITVRENARVVRDENGEVLYYEGTLTDVTERIGFENQLRESQKMEALGRLAGGIARDFRAIGAGIMSRLKQALEVLPHDSPARPLLDVVGKSIDSGGALTRQILDFSHNARRRESRARGRSAIDLNALVTELTPLLSRLAGPHCPVELSLCDHPVPVLADRGALRQLLSSFVIYARGYGTAANKIEITTEIESRSTAATPFVSLSVRSASPDGSPQPGEIGMATSQAILAQYGGTMTTTIGPGSADPEVIVRYSMYLPLAMEAHLTPSPTESEDPSLSSPSATVLLLEREPLIREISRDMLERQGFRVCTAGDTSEAERIARSPQDFDVLITDWAIDGEGSKTLVQLLRETRPGLRVLYLAGYSDTLPDSGSLPLRSAILPKPFSGESLGRKIRHLLERSLSGGT